MDITYVCKLVIHYTYIHNTYVRMYTYEKSRLKHFHTTRNNLQPLKQSKQSNSLDYEPFVQKYRTRSRMVNHTYIHYIRTRKPILIYVVLKTVT